LLAVGIFVLVQVIMPQIIFQIWEWSAFGGNSFLVDPQQKPGSVLGISVENIGNFSAFHSDASPADLPYTNFYLSIPSIHLPATDVLVASNTFEHSLAQLPGTALPGERGNVFVTGHSSLQQFYSPTNFQAIFSHLPEVKKGDDILVTAAGQVFTYQVIGMTVVDPKDTGVINPPDSTGRYLSLMTCVPPGLSVKRLIVLAQLKE
jgi:LPXTG-site transpeptidase (sortase) family protein